MNAKTVDMESAAGHDTTHNHGSPSNTKSLDWGKDKLMLDLQAAVDDAQALLKEAINSTSHGVADAPDYLSDRFGAVKSQLQKVKTAVETKARHATAMTEQYVSENPWKSMGFATAASICISVLLVSASMASMWKTLGDRK